MKIRILGGGFYGCHLAVALIEAGHNVEVHEIKDGIFQGASGRIPARIHQGYHYPRSKKTREACQKHEKEFLQVYGNFVRDIPVNIYAIAKDDSLVDFDQYKGSLRYELDFLEIDAGQFGLMNVEGALLTKEKHIVTDQVRDYFIEKLGQAIQYKTEPGEVDSREYDWTIDATFCANESAGIDRYEPCVVGLAEGITNTAITIMDGPFSSLYPWNESRNLNSLSSAKYTPLSKECETWKEANEILKSTTKRERIDRAYLIQADLVKYFPAAAYFRIADALTSIRAMPRSGADARLVDVIKVGERALRIRAGKIDAVIHAEKLINGMIEK